MKKSLMVLLWSLANCALATPTIQVLVSFSMPEQLMRETLAESARLHIPAVLNGLYHNSMLETAKKVLALTRVLPNLNLQIDPTAFQRFGIKQVPALIVSGDQGFDVIYGNLSLRDGLSRIVDIANDSGLVQTDLRRILGE